MTPTEKPIQQFEWDERKEDAQSERYMKWLHANIALPPHTAFFNVSSANHLLSTSHVSSKYKFSGTLDVAVIDDAYASRSFVVCGIKIGFELKNVTTYNDNQAIIKLLIAGLSSEYAVVMVLTNLRNVWRFFWLEKTEQDIYVTRKVI